MGKKNKRTGMGNKKFTATPPASPSLSAEHISRRGKKVMGAGVLALIAGFWLLTFTDPAGQNWASTLSPFLLIAGYIVIGIGITVRDPVPPQASPSSSST